MARIAKLLLAGVVPLLAGYLLNYAIVYLQFPAFGFLLVLLELVLLLLWGCMAYRITSPDRNPAVQSLLLCTLGLLMLILVVWQEMILGQYWFNLIGSASQLYFLPLLTLVSTVLTPLLRFVEMIRPCYYYFFIWVILFLVSLAGCLWKRKKYL